MKKVFIPLFSSIVYIGAIFLVSISALASVAPEQYELTTTTFNKPDYGIRRTKIKDGAKDLWLAKFVEHCGNNESEPMVQVTINFGNCIDDQQKYTLLLTLMQCEEMQTRQLLSARFPQALHALDNNTISQTTTAKAITSKQSSDNNAHIAKNKKLLAAVQTGELEAVKKVLEDKPDIDACDDDGNTSLIIAAQRGDVAIVKLLKAHNANLALQAKSGKTALFAAAHSYQTKVLRTLLDSGLPVESEDQSGKTLLEIFAFNRNKVMVNWLLRKKAADMHHKSAHCNVSLVNRIAAFAHLDEDYAGIYSLFKAEESAREQARIETLQKQHKTQNDEALKLTKKLLKPKENQSVDSKEADEHHNALIARQEKLEQEACLVHKANEKAERLARHEKSMADKAQQAQKSSSSASTATAAAPTECKVEAPKTKKLVLYADYNVIYSEEAEEQKKSIDKKTMETIIEKINAFKNGERKDVKKMADADTWRLKANYYYRVIFKLDNEDKTILVKSIALRKDVYK